MSNIIRLIYPLALSTVFAGCMLTPTNDTLSGIPEQNMHAETKSDSIKPVSSARTSFNAKPPLVSSEDYYSEGEDLSLGIISAIAKSGSVGAKNRITISLDCAFENEQFDGIGRPIKNLLVKAHIIYINNKTKQEFEKRENLYSNEKGIFGVFLDAADFLDFKYAELEINDFHINLSQKKAYRITFYDCEQKANR